MKIKVDNKEFTAKKGETLFDLANREDLKIPFLCHHPDLSTAGSCRVCVVRLKGEDDLKAACQLKLKEGMEIVTTDSEIERVRKINLELLFAQHKEECDDCVWNPGCKLLSLARKYKVKINRFLDRKRDYPNLNFGGIIDFDSSKCIDCRSCIEVCDLQAAFLEMEGKGHKFEVVPARERVCIYCGQCITHCPAGAFESVGEFEGVNKAFEEKDKNIIFQIAPAARVSIGEEFGLKPGIVSTGKLITGLKKLGANKVYDVSVGADLTTIEEADEFIERFKEDNLPMFTSCCPAWVRFVEFYYPQFVDNLTTVRSPHIILGGLIKEFNDPKETIVVSVMPCVAKKYEISREELYVNGHRPVDYVLTVREVGRLFRDNQINFKKLEESEFDQPFGIPSGDGVGYGASGGVMKAALKQVFYQTEKKLEVESLSEEELSVDFNEKQVKTKRASGISEIIKVLEELKENPNAYDYLEFMACPGGCIGGGGQPIPTSKEVIKKRKEGLKKAVDSKKEDTSKNKKIKDIYNKYRSRKLFRTKFKAKRRPETIDSN